MIDLRGLPLPEGAPEPGRCVRVERPEQGLALLVIDPPHRKVALLDLAVLRDLDLALDALDGDRHLRGLVVTGRDPLNFLAGADLDALEATLDPLPVARTIRIGQALFDRFSRLRSGHQRVRTVAAVGGVVPGGAYELALACDRILLADDPSSRIGLPETKLGIVPAWGGCERLPRRLGTVPAMQAILEGSLFPARPAWKKGLVDRLTPPEYLLRVAADVALGRRACERRGRGPLARVLLDRNPLVAWAVERRSTREVLRRTRGRYPAALEAARLVAWAPLKPLARGFRDEELAGARLATGPVCKNLIGVFRLMEGAKKLARRPDGGRVAPVRRAGVVGAGVMGGAIASVLAEKGVATRLHDLAGESLDAALVEHRRELSKKLARKRLRQHEHDAALDRLDATRELVGFGRVELVIEAVAERLEVKRALFAELARKIPAGAILCTNTSSLSVDALATGLPGPERFAGLHFFNPVRRMPLVEIVRGSHTSDAVVTRLAALCLALGKTPVVVRDVPGFLVNRLLGPYLDEALCLYAQGAPPLRIEEAALAFGLPMGPLRLLDEVGLDIAAHASRSLHEAYGARMQPGLELEPFLSKKRLGKKSGLGFYVHPPRGGRGEPKLAEDLAQILPPRSSVAADLSDADLADRLVFALLAEAFRALDEDVVASGAELDLATVLGMGFPPFRGGLLRWASTLGAGTIGERLAAIAASPGVVDRPGGAERYALPLTEVASRLRA